MRPLIGMPLFIKDINGLSRDLSNNSIGVIYRVCHLGSDHSDNLPPSRGVCMCGGERGVG